MNTEKMPKWAAGLALLLLPAFAWFHGFAVSKVWLWLVVPMGAPALNVWQAAGLLFSLRAIQGRKEKKDDDWQKTMAVIVMWPVVFLAVGWLCAAAWHW